MVERRLINSLSLSLESEDETFLKLLILKNMNTLLKIFLP